MVQILISAISPETIALFMSEPLSGNTISENNNTPNLVKVLKAVLKIQEKQHKITAFFQACLYPPPEMILEWHVQPEVQ